MPGIYRRRKTWWISYNVAKKRRRESLATKDERLARKKLRKLEYEHSTGNLEIPSLTPIDTFLQAFCEHLETVRSPKAFKNDISYLRTVFGPVCDSLKPRSTLNHRHEAKRPINVKDKLAKRHVQVTTLEQFTAGVINEHVTKRIRLDHIAPKTANRIREVLHVMFAYAIREHGFRSPDHRFPNPVDAVPRRREDDPEIRFLTLKQIDRQLTVLKDHPLLHTMVAVYIYAGLRREEALWLTHADVSLEAGLIRIRKKTVAGETWRPKTRKNRRVPISRVLRRYLEAYDPPASTPWFFPSPTGKRWDPDNFSETLRDVNKAAGFPWSCLDFRHTFGSHLGMKGESLFKISELMGNSPEICRKHYAALIPEEMRDTVEFDPRPRIVQPAEADSA